MEVAHVIAHFQKGNKTRYAGVGADGINAAEGLEGLGDDLAHGDWVGNVSRKGDGLRASVAQGGRDIFHFGQPVDEHNLAAMLGASFGDAAPDAPGRTRYENRLSAQFAHDDSFPDLRMCLYGIGAASLSRATVPDRHRAVEEARSFEMAKTRRFSYFGDLAALRPRKLTWSFASHIG